MKLVTKQLLLMKQIVLVMLDHWIMTSSWVYRCLVHGQIGMNSTKLLFHCMLEWIKLDWNTSGSFFCFGQLGK